MTVIICCRVYTMSRQRLSLTCYRTHREV